MLKAQGKALPTDLYSYVPVAETRTIQGYSIKVNGQDVAVELKDGFSFGLHVAWKAGDDVVEVHLPMEARQVVAHEEVEADRGLVAIERGPLVYCLEGVDNGGSLAGIALSPSTSFVPEYKTDLLGGVTILQGQSRRQGRHCRALSRVGQPRQRRDAGVADARK